jgi:hypothetical protein
MIKLSAGSAGTEKWTKKEGGVGGTPPNGDNSVIRPAEPIFYLGGNPARPFLRTKFRMIPVTNDDKDMIVGSLETAAIRNGVLRDSSGQARISDLVA